MFRLVSRIVLYEVEDSPLSSSRRLASCYDITGQFIVSAKQFGKKEILLLFSQRRGSKTSTSERLYLFLKYYMNNSVAV